MCCGHATRTKSSSAKTSPSKQFTSFSRAKSNSPNPSQSKSPKNLSRTKTNPISQKKLKSRSPGSAITVTWVRLSSSSIPKPGSSLPHHWKPTLYCSKFNPCFSSRSSASSPTFKRISLCQPNKSSLWPMKTTSNKKIKLSKCSCRNLKTFKTKKSKRSSPISWSMTRATPKTPSSPKPNPQCSKSSPKKACSSEILTKDSKGLANFMNPRPTTSAQLFVSSRSNPLHKKTRHTLTTSNITSNKPSTSR